MSTNGRQKAVNKAASTLAKFRWAKVPKKDRVKAAKTAAAGRMDKMTPERRSEVARIASESIPTETRKKAAMKAWETKRRKKAG